MDPFNYAAPAELFSPARGGSKRGPLVFRRFSDSAEAVRFAVEELPEQALQYTVLEVDDGRFDAHRIRELYESDGFPLLRRRTG